MPRGEVDAPIAAAFPVHQPAYAGARQRLRALMRIEAPDLGPGRGIQREDAKLGGGCVQHTVRDDRLALHLGAFEPVAGVVRPRDTE
jgi:hypothetical protein